ncbi:MAG: Uma2 family endonuclease [Aphanizomenon gracile PMC649.10]|nr:Uma2 family endonuclease [Aphanizomenon gracile PMC638.10]MDM3850655.1 Uma2 family endonuclease [Aphanizomenon gracile PMC627.10]MDM3854962.1 Uma2 family endonuclease [Aphanizomenon gracile PMC649.10]MDM3861845.1 Uma2 family endonuclease [Aphanizomenon gracile PMC644.10]
MSETLADIAIPPQFPDHTQLPESDGTFVKNFQEHPQSIIITDSIIQTLQTLHPDGQFCIGQDCGIYWRETEPPEKGSIAPDWFYVPDVAPRLDGKIRRSYVLWREYIPPLIAIELASGNGNEERDTTPLAGLQEGEKPGKFWVYERIIRIPYYAIYEVNNDRLEVYHLVDFSYQKIQPNERGHYPIAPLGVELGLWQGSYLNNPEQLWLRWWDLDGNLLLVGKEEAQLQKLRAEQAEHKAAKLAARLREMGINPDDDL